jgi:hypothetical protein
MHADKHSSYKVNRFLRSVDKSYDSVRIVVYAPSALVPVRARAAA